MGRPFCPEGDELRVNKLVKDAVMQNAAESPCSMVQYHYSDAIMSAMASQTTGVSIFYSTVCLDADQRNIKALHHWPLWGEFTGDLWIPRTKGQ